ncbi:ribosomal-protein-alanine N-acetyltransferase [Paenibacillus sp. PastF-3]|uniref:GNAT family N-acetyltransferase n=1 Tax=Paenibacillus sp. PastF-3 TaxID=2940626 RepID=UPI002473F931|nr:GNAT family protein [Paenibacillus sp. PastF-3]MDH6371626.1 ribosomal-protein-alanine N-acetyltransferase [Paenibacillus sp. PastF-3]
MSIINPYQVCPVFESERLIYRLVQEEDAEDLLECYSDAASIPLFNSDNCTNDFNFQMIEEMSGCIRFWLDEYAGHSYVRFSIVEKDSDKAVGTIEFFARNESVEGVGVIGVLRLDLISRLENEGVLTEILSMIEKEFYDCFGVDAMITKAIPAAKQRITALLNSGYSKIEGNALVSFYDYYMISRVSG